MQRDSDSSIADPVLVGLRQELHMVEASISTVFQSMRSVEAANMASARLREYKAKLEKATVAYIKNRVGLNAL